MTDKAERARRDTEFYSRALPEHSIVEVVLDVDPITKPKQPNPYLTGAYHRSSRNAARKLMGAPAARSDAED